MINHLLLLSFILIFEILCLNKNANYYNYIINFVLWLLAVLLKIVSFHNLISVLSGIKDCYWTYLALQVERSRVRFPMVSL